MNNKLLFAVMSLAALTACTNDDFESQKVAEGTSPIQFEVINTNDAVTRASLKPDGVSVKWSALDNDLFTLYHGVAYTDGTPQPVAGYQNATYTAEMSGSTATLTTPSMILPGGAIMVYPVDTVFNIKSGDNLSISIPVVLPAEKIENYIPHVSDLVEIEDEANWAKPTAAYNKAGYKRSYPIYMRAMASQLTLKADYGETENELKKLYTGGSEQPEDGGIHEITLTSVDLLTNAGGATKFTQQIPLTFAIPAGEQGSNWNNVANNNWKQVTGVDREDVSGNTIGVAKLTTKYISGTESCRFLILPQKTIAGGVAKAAIAVNTYYGKVLIAKSGEYPESKYSDDQYNKAWYRYVSSAKTETGEENASTPGTGDYANKHKVVAKSPALGMQQTINFFGDYTAPDGSTVEGEYMGVATERFVTVDLTKLDMSDLHIKTDKQLRDVARVWKKLGLDPVTVILDDDEDGEGDFHISQKTIEVINTVNEGKSFAKWFTVKPCDVTATGENINKIVITGSDYKQEMQNITFIKNNGVLKASVVLADEGTAKPWKLTGDVKVHNSVAEIINLGTMVNAEDATLRTVTNASVQHNSVPFVNNGTWTISGGELNVQFDVTNNGTVTIAAGAEYRQAKGSANTTFTNQATAKPTRFGGNDAMIGKVHNSGVFATLAATGSAIYNYGEIYHDAEAAKTYITKNQTDPVDFAGAFGDANKMGIIILPYGNKDEDNISISHALEQGFVAVAVSADDAPADGILNATVVGPRVNYIMINGGITKVSDMPAAQIKYVEFNSGTTEIEWQVEAPQTYEGMMVLSPVNVKLGTDITVTKATYLGKNMYVGGIFTNNSWNGYFGDTAANEATMYITY